MRNSQASILKDLENTIETMERVLLEFAQMKESVGGKGGIFSIWDKGTGRISLISMIGSIPDEEFDQCVAASESAGKYLIENRDMSIFQAAVATPSCVLSFAGLETGEANMAITLTSAIGLSIIAPMEAKEIAEVTGNQLFQELINRCQFDHFD
jgi:hypothetical protein